MDGPAKREATVEAPVELVARAEEAPGLLAAEGDLGELELVFLELDGAGHDSIRSLGPEVFGREGVRVAGIVTGADHHHVVATCFRRSVYRNTLVGLVYLMSHRTFRYAPAAFQLGLVLCSTACGGVRQGDTCSAGNETWPRLCGSLLDMRIVPARCLVPLGLQSPDCNNYEESRFGPGPFPLRYWMTQRFAIEVRDHPWNPSDKNRVGGGLCEVALEANVLSGREGLGACYTLELDMLVESDGSLSCRGVELKAGCLGYRLPTREEWEYVAYLAGWPTKTTDEGHRPVDLVDGLGDVLWTSPIRAACSHGMSLIGYHLDISSTAVPPRLRIDDFGVCRGEQYAVRYVRSLP